MPADQTFCPTCRRWTTVPSLPTCRTCGQHTPLTCGHLRDQAQAIPAGALGAGVPGPHRGVSGEPDAGGIAAV
jgi:hypothetical protein